MLHAGSGRVPQQIGFLLLPRFSMICLLSAIEPLRGANRMLGYEAYRWHFLATDNEPVTASNGMAIVPGHRIADAPEISALGVVASYEPLAAVDGHLLQWLRACFRQGLDIGAFETGTSVLAEAGLLAGRRVTLHWETLPAFRERHLDVDARDALFEIDPPLFTCSGGTAAMDLMLQLLARDHSAALAAAVSEQFLHSDIRPANAGQRMDGDRRIGMREPLLATVTEIMRAHLENPLSLPEVATQAGVSQRRLERLFAQHLGTPPQRYYLELRLEHARQLLQHGELPIHEIALACGFGSASWFTRAYRQHFGHPPRRERDG